MASPSLQNSGVIPNTVILTWAKLGSASEIDPEAAGSTAHCAAAAAKSLQSCPTLCDPIDGSPPGSAAPTAHCSSPLIVVSTTPLLLSTPKCCTEGFC